ncbi:hypothetical protein BV25DRAFT_617083 [Artomyces pyxidatus]|uniref:Uncharacterized protein n=1 Tax=Artomyces pyxidatus TaxID=48021 RepID=A0ACB8T3D7_9AGAM|nr:hypothetical protein BV25DRAFT_617083 [Artomyces pyxidatus]
MYGRQGVAVAREAQDVRRTKTASCSHHRITPVERPSRSPAETEPILVSRWPLDLTLEVLSLRRNFKSSCFYGRPPPSYTLRPSPLTSLPSVVRRPSALQCRAVLVLFFAFSRLVAPTPPSSRPHHRCLLPHPRRLCSSNASWLPLSASQDVFVDCTASYPTTSIHSCQQPFPLVSPFDSVTCLCQRGSVHQGDAALASVSQLDCIYVFSSRSIRDDASELAFASHRSPARPFPVISESYLAAPLTCILEEILSVKTFGGFPHHAEVV